MENFLATGLVEVLKGKLALSVLIASLGAACGSAKAGQSPPDSIEPFKGAEGSYHLYGTYSGLPASIFGGLKITLSNTVTSTITGLPLITTEDCPVKRWVVGHGSLKEFLPEISFKATLCLGDDGKIAWRCGAGTTCLPLPLPGGAIAGGSGELAQKGVCQGPVSPETTREGYLAVLCRDSSECLPKGENCQDQTNAPWRVALNICVRLGSTESCLPVILEKTASS